MQTTREAAAHLRIRELLLTLQETNRARREAEHALFAAKEEARDQRDGTSAGRVCAHRCLLRVLCMRAQIRQLQEVVGKSKSREAALAMKVARLEAGRKRDRLSSLGSPPLSWSRQQRVESTAKRQTDRHTDTQQTTAELVIERDALRKELILAHNAVHAVLRRLASVDATQAERPGSIDMQTTRCREPLGKRAGDHLGEPGCNAPTPSE
jgi:hypothetical protein